MPKRRPAANEIETRFIPAVELRVSGDPAKPTISGYAALFGSRSADLGGFVEVIRPGAFTGSLDAGGDVMGRYNHELLLGRTSNGTARVSEDDKGLQYELDVNADDAEAVAVASRIRRQDVRGSSFAFRVLKDEWRSEGGAQIRELIEVELVDVGPVDQPAYAETETVGAVSVRALKRAKELRADAGAAAATEPDDAAEESDLVKAAGACVEQFKACTAAARAFIDAAAAMTDDANDDDLEACEPVASFGRVCAQTLFQAMDAICSMTGDYSYYRSLQNELLKIESRQAPAADADLRSQRQRQAEATL